MKIDVYENLLAWADEEPKRTMHHASRTVKRLAGLSQQPLANSAHVDGGELNIILGVNSLTRQRLVANGVIPKPEFEYHGKWSVRQVRKMIEEGIKTAA